MKKGIDIHNYKKRLESAQRKVARAAISDLNKQKIEEFCDYVLVDGMSIARVERYYGILVQFAEWLEVDFTSATKEDMVRVMRILHEKDFTVWTKATYKKMLKRFYKWLSGTGEYPETVSWINSKVKKTERRQLTSSELLTPEEVHKMVDAARHPRDKAFVSLLYESGCRVGELASVQIKNVAIDEHGAKLLVDGKTGQRVVRVITSTPYLVTWLQMHPSRDDPEAPVWVNVGTYSKHAVMQYNAISTMLRKLASSAGIRKQCNPHMFRHARASYLADHLTEFQMNQYFGWVQGSEMASTYVHMDGRKIDETLLQMHGMKPVQKKEMETARRCPRCGTINVPDAKYCMKCAAILNVSVAAQLAEDALREREMLESQDNRMGLLFRDPEFRTVYMQKVKQYGIE